MIRLTPEQANIVGIITAILLIIFPGLIIVYAGCQHDKKMHKAHVAYLQQTVNNFANPGKIVEIYAYRTGTKAANYAYPIGCVIEDQNGKRLVLDNIDKPAIEGDYWNICFNGYKIALCEQVKQE